MVSKLYGNTVLKMTTINMFVQKNKKIIQFQFNYFKSESVHPLAVSHTHLHTEYSVFE